jgi:acyl-coenzyme A synthetase/AMP-(fatty) acid ligase
LNDYPHIPERLNIATLTIDRNIDEGRGDKIALYFGGRLFTYRDLQRMINACGNALRRLGIDRGDRFVIRSTNCPEYLVAFLAGLKIGAVPIPTNSLFRLWELEHILNNSGAKAVFTTGELMEPILAVKDRCPSVQHLITFDVESSTGALPFHELVCDGATELQAADTTSAETAFIIYTSGTTGEPKGVEHAHRWIIATGDPISKILMRLTNDDISFSPLEISFIYALGCNFLYPLYSGAAIAMIPGRFDAERTLTAIQELRPTVLIAVPTLFRRLFASGDLLEKHDLSSLRAAFSSGEPLPDDTLRTARERLGIEIYDCLGQTEIHIFMNPDPKRKLGSLGRPLPGHVVTILNDDGREADIGEIGHLVIRADDPGLCLGYRGKPDIWRQTQRDGWYYTKDLAYRDEDNFFWYVSRSDDLIKSRAYLISPREVECALMEHPAVLEAGVIGVPDDIIGQRIKAHVILRPNYRASDALAAEITSAVSQKIAPFKVPKEIVFVDSLPRTATGKLMRRELREQSIGQTGAGTRA